MRTDDDWHRRIAEERTRGLRLPVHLSPLGTLDPLNSLYEGQRLLRWLIFGGLLLWVAARTLAHLRS